MALRPCPECGRRISDTAEECPGCGAAQPSYCLDCEKPVDDDATECPHCGCVFEEEGDDEEGLSANTQLAVFAGLVLLVLLWGYAKYRAGEGGRQLGAIQKGQQLLKADLDAMEGRRAWGN